MIRSRHSSFIERTNTSAFVTSCDSGAHKPSTLTERRPSMGLFGSVRAFNLLLLNAAVQFGAAVDDVLAFGVVCSELLRDPATSEPTAPAVANGAALFVAA